jgi:hypothetical protein
MPHRAAPLLLALLALACQRVPIEESTLTDGDDSTSTSTTTSGESTTAVDPSAGEGGIQPQYKCDPADLETCDDGLKCTALLRDGRQNVYECVNNDAMHNLYEPCVPSPLDGQDGCSPSSICQPTNDEGDSGLCMPLCTKTTECGGGACVANPFNRVPSCSEACDPLGSICPAGLACRRAEDRFGCMVPTASDIGEQTAQCLKEGDRGCSEGYVCEAGDLIPACASPTGFCCTSLCDLEAVDPCASPATCNAIWSDPAPGYEWIGACYVPF